MSAYEKIIIEINATLDALAERREAWVAPWVAKAICAEHERALLGDQDDDDRAFWETTGYAYTRKMVTECINKRTQGDSRDARQQLALPGFTRTHLQDYYLVERDGIDQGICVLDLTDDEIDEKVRMHRKQAAASYAHADELERFKSWRSAQRQSA